MKKEIIADPFNPACPSREILELIGGKWSVLLICMLQSGPIRTGSLMRSVPDISQKMLTQTLRELQNYGIVERISYPEVPPRVEYRLTQMGHSLAGVVRELEGWIVAHYAELQSFQEVMKRTHQKEARAKE